PGPGHGVGPDADGHDERRILHGQRRRLRRRLVLRPRPPHAAARAARGVADQAVRRASGGAPRIRRYAVASRAFARWPPAPLRSVCSGGPSHLNTPIGAPAADRGPPRETGPGIDPPETRD